MAAIKTAGRLAPIAAACWLLSCLAVPAAVAAPDEHPGLSNQPSARPVDESGQAADPIEGFRSAHFGMTEDEVRKAIRQDFGTASETIKTGANHAERTRLLTVSVPDLIPGGGRAVVAYVFGYKTKQLIQVGITWSKATDPTITPKTLASDSEVLHEYFLKAGYVPASIELNKAIEHGVLVFRGADPKGRETALLLLGTLRKEADNKQVLTPASLQLIYVDNPKHPDVFRLQKGKF